MWVFCEELLKFDVIKRGLKCHTTIRHTPKRFSIPICIIKLLDILLNLFFNFLSVADEMAIYCHGVLPRNIGVLDNNDFLSNLNLGE
jgi:hypothetical protein